MERFGGNPLLFRLVDEKEAEFIDSCSRLCLWVSVPSRAVEIEPLDRKDAAPAVFQRGFTWEAGSFLEEFVEYVECTR